MTRIIVILLFMVSCLMGRAQNYFYKTVDLPNKAIPQVISQDANGYMWVGTSQGLYRFDGNIWNLFSKNDSTSKQSVTAIYQTRDHTIWVGYEDGKIYLLQKGNYTPFLPEEGNPVVKITGFSQDLEGNVWIATYGEGLFIYTGNRLFNVNQDDGLKDDDVYCIHLGPHGKIWAGGDRGVGICSFVNKQKEVKTIGKKEGFPDEIIRSMTPASDGAMWLGTYGKGVFKYNDTEQNIYLPHSAGNLPEGPITSISGQGNKIWMGTEKSGILCYEGQHFLAKKNTDPIQVNDVFFDNQGNLWVATHRNGLMRTQPIFDFAEFPNTNIKAICQKQKGTLWVSTPEGIFGYDPISKETEVIWKGKEYNIVSLYEDVAGNTWAGTFGKGVLRFFPGSNKFERYTESDGLVNGSVLSIDGNNEEVFLGTLGGVSSCNILTANQKAKFVGLNGENKLDINYIYQVLSTDDGSMYIATDGNGLFHTTENKAPQKIIDDQTVFSIVKGVDHTFWVNSQENGLIQIVEGKQKMIPTLSDLDNSPISSLGIFDANQVIMIRKEGVTVYNPETSVYTNFGEEMGLMDLDAELNAICPPTISQKQGDGIWFGTRSGLVKFSPAGDSLDIKPKMLIKNISIFKNPIGDRNPLELNHNENDINISVVGLWYQNPSAVKYRHRLPGVANNWIYTHDLSITYPNLPPGSYTFEVQSTHDTWIPAHISTATFDFRIHFPFWQTWWFVTLALLVFGGLSYQLITIRESRLKNKEKMEKEKIEFQFETLKSQVNPHFLFNSLNTLVSVIEEDPVEAVGYVEKLSDFYRSMLEYRNRDLILIEEELTMLQDYFYLQEMRFGSALSLTVQVNENARKGKIAPLTLQMLVENALKHNVISKKHPMEIIVKSNNKYIEIENAIQKKRRPEVSTRMGLQNISNRYALLTSNEVSVEIKNNRFVVRVPILP